jgi:hypothetical protein
MEICLLEFALRLRARCTCADRYRLPRCRRSPNRALTFISNSNGNRRCGCA